MSSKLPPRLYYTPEEAAEALSDHFKEKVTAAYLYHLAATHRLRLSAIDDGLHAALIPALYLLAEFDKERNEFAPFDARQFMSMDAVSGAREIASWDYSSSGFFVLPSQYALSLQRQGVANVTHLVDYIDSHWLDTMETDSYSMVKRTQRKLDEAGLPRKFSVFSLDCIALNESADLEFLKNYKSMNQQDIAIKLTKIHHPGLRITSDSVVILLPELERLISGAPLEQEPEPSPDTIARLRASQKPSPKTDNAQVKLIATLCQIIGGDISKPRKAAENVIRKIDLAGLKSPIGDRALANYLQMAGGVEEKDEE